jgi:hypothetical protein
MTLLNGQYNDASNPFCQGEAFALIEIWIPSYRIAFPARIAQYAMIEDMQYWLNQFLPN